MLCVFTTLFSNCKKSELVDGQLLNNKHNGLASAKDGQNDLLGYGYDVLGEYANSSAAKFSVVDVVRLKTDHPTRVEWDFATKQEGILDAGSDAVSYLKKLTTRFSNTFGAELLGLSLFKATINAAYNETDNFSSRNIYSSYRLKIQQKRVKFNAPNDLLKSYLSPSFLSDVQSQSPEYIVSRYGTHVLTDIILGTKLEALYKSETSKSERTIASSAGVDLSVKLIFKLNTGYTYDSNDIVENTSQKLQYRTIGGDPTQSLVGQVPIGNASNPNPTPTVVISGWQSTSTLANSEMIDITPDGLMPIYDLIPDPSKALAVKNYVIQYLTNNQANLIIDENYNPTQEGKLLRTPDGRVFSVMNGKARHIQDYGTLQAVYNFETTTIIKRPPFNPIVQVTSNIKQISTLSELGLTEGPPIPPGAELLRDSGNGRTYFYEHTAQGVYMLRYITSPDVANKYYFKLSNARNIPSTFGYVLGAIIQ